MDARDLLKHSFSEFPSLYRGVGDVIQDILLGNGTGYEWNEEGLIYNTCGVQTSSDTSAFHSAVKAHRIEYFDEYYDQDSIMVDEILSSMRYVYLTHSPFENVPINISDEWKDIIDSLYRKMKSIGITTSPSSKTEKVEQVLANFEKTEYYKNILEPKNKEIENKIRKFLESQS